MAKDIQDLKRLFKEIRERVEQAANRSELTELYKRAIYPIMMTHGGPADEDAHMALRRVTAEKEFGRVARLINKQAKKIGSEPNYSEKWDELAANGYRTEDENLLKPENG